MAKNKDCRVTVGPKRGLCNRSVNTICDWFNVELLCDKESGLSDGEGENQPASPLHDSDLSGFWVKLHRYASRYPCGDLHAVLRRHAGRLIRDELPMRLS